jgi:hypothetical protein
MPDYHEIHSGGKKHYQQQDMESEAMELVGLSRYEMLKL